MVEFFNQMLTFTDKVFTLVIDDANVEQNVAITKGWVEKQQLRVLYERELLNDQEDDKMWWNGLYVLVIAK